MTAKSKDNNEINVSKIGKIKKKPTCACKQLKNYIYFIAFFKI